MRSIIFAVVVSLAACATSRSSGPRPINVAAVRSDIKSEIKGDRQILSMGKVTADTAEVYTENSTKARRRETWVKADGAWKLQESKDVATMQ